MVLFLNLLRTLKQKSKEKKDIINFKPETK